MKIINTTDRLLALRHEMQKQHLDAFILNMEDSHFSEYLSPADKRIAYISGFTGSAGNAIITKVGKAALWTDGRYHNQASQELDSNWILMREGLPNVPSMISWLSLETPSCGRIGFDPQRIPFKSVESMQRELNVLSMEMSQNRTFVPLEGPNLIDIVWENKPSRSFNPIRVVPEESLAGQSWMRKVDALRSQMKQKCSTAVVIFQLDEIAWLFNVRGSDISYNPVFFSYVIITMENVHLFVDGQRGSNSVNLEQYLKSSSHNVCFHPYKEFFTWLCTNSDWRIGRVWLPIESSYSIVSVVPEKQRFFDISPAASLKAIKTPQEVEGMRQTNLVDSWILCDFLAWLDDVSHNGKMDPTSVTPCDVTGVFPTTMHEASIATYLDGLRLASNRCLGLSFSTISGADANGAVIHHCAVNDATSSLLTSNSLFLIDSGGQYTTGTTDVTRTVHLGTPSKEQISDFTAVLKAHAGLASLTFPDNTTGTQLDVVCRASMWRSQRDYPHGTGHGVGANLCVHEGPIGMSGRKFQSFFDMRIKEPGIRKNMVLTIEPGYYLNGEYGIRLENVNLVVDCPSGSRASPINFLGFEPLTLVPFQRCLIDKAALVSFELKWLNEYHALVREKLLDWLKVEQNGRAMSSARERTRDWILRETEPL